ncbi:MAG TPA: thiol:disulfide interchange protein DsbA/DsbL [Burkholderiales bacterium]|nr:thiol:disulfide interchange protein DsbA/DsbL [Burkholderiales bacterium]
MKRLTILLSAALLWAFMIHNAGAQLVQGRDYLPLTPPQPTEDSKKIEVIEFFWYGCPHCYHLEPSLNAWLRHKPADVEFRRVPAVLQSAWMPLTRTYYALVALGVADKYHSAIFEAIHKEGKRNLITDPNAIADWLATKGLDKQKFLDAYNSFAVNGRSQRAVDISGAYNIDGTPTLAINGKYLIAPHMDGYATDGQIDYAAFFRGVDQLIAQERKGRK